MCRTHHTVAFNLCTDANTSTQTAIKPIKKEPGQLNSMPGKRERRFMFWQERRSHFTWGVELVSQFLLKYWQFEIFLKLGGNCLSTPCERVCVLGVKDLKNKTKKQDKTNWQMFSQQVIITKYINQDPDEKSSKGFISHDCLTLHYSAYYTAT